MLFIEAMPAISTRKKSLELIIQSNNQSIWEESLIALLALILSGVVGFVVVPQLLPKDTDATKDIMSEVARRSIPALGFGAPGGFSLWPMANVLKRRERSRKLMALMPLLDEFENEENNLSEGEHNMISNVLVELLSVK